MDYEYEEVVPKPTSLKDVDYQLYYMFSNSLDPIGTTYRKLTSDGSLTFVAKVYRRKGE